MGFLIDTNLWIDVERGQLSAADIHAITGQRPIYLSPVNVAELEHGIQLLEDPREQQKARATMRRLKRKPLLRITGATAEVFGTLSANLTKRGRNSEHRVQDLWLAAQAVQRDLTLITRNAKDFKDIPELKLIAL